MHSTAQLKNHFNLIFGLPGSNGHLSYCNHLHLVSSVYAYIFSEVTGQNENKLCSKLFCVPYQNVCL